MVAAENKRLCFVIAPIGRAGSPERLHSDEVFDRIIRPPVEACGYSPKRADHDTKPGMISRDMIESIYKAPLVVANLTGNNPNVFYELAFRHTLEKPAIIIVPEGQDIPFDMSHNRAIDFNLNDDNNVEKAKELIMEQIKLIESSEDGFYNPISASLDLIIAFDEAQFTPGDVRKALNRVPDLEKEGLTRQVGEAYYAMRSRGIFTKQELREMMSKENLDILRRLYIEELLRDEAHPIDPMAIAFWGTDLYIGGQSDMDEAVRVVRQHLRMSQEYLQRHGELVIHAAYFGFRGFETLGKGVSDVTLILKRSVENGQLHFPVSIDKLGDPAERRRKELKVMYSYRDQHYLNKVAQEDGYMDLP